MLTGSEEWTYSAKTNTNLREGERGQDGQSLQAEAARGPLELLHHSLHRTTLWRCSGRKGRMAICPWGAVVPTSTP